MNFIKAKTVKAHKKYAHNFDYFANHKIKKDFSQRSLKWFYGKKTENSIN